MVAMRHYRSEFMRRDRFFGSDLVVVREAPTFRARTLAGPTPDAESAVIEDCLRHIKTSNSVLAEIDLKV
jgi:hypothetical protein